MDEHEYVLATNLAKINIAERLIRDTIFSSMSYNIRRKALVKELNDLGEEVQTMVNVAMEGLNESKTD